jgi:hypothetical protein
MDQGTTQGDNVINIISAFRPSKRQDVGQLNIEIPEKQNLEKAFE